jgi:hypothetical protein
MRLPIGLMQFSNSDISPNDQGKKYLASHKRVGYYSFMDVENATAR